MTIHRPYKTAFAILTLLACTACAGNAPRATADPEPVATLKTADRPCAADRAYFEAQEGAPASSRCHATERDAYMRAWEQGLVDAMEDNNRYITKARDIQLKALDTLQNTDDAEKRLKAERLFKSMNSRIRHLQKRNLKLDTLLATVRPPLEKAPTVLTATAD